MVEIHILKIVHSCVDLKSHHYHVRVHLTLKSHCWVVHDPAILRSRLCMSQGNTSKVLFGIPSVFVYLENNYMMVFLNLFYFQT